MFEGSYLGLVAFVVAAMLLPTALVAFDPEYQWGGVAYHWSDSAYRSAHSALVSSPYEISYLEGRWYVNGSYRQCFDNSVGQSLECQTSPGYVFCPSGETITANLWGTAGGMSPGSKSIPAVLECNNPEEQ